MKLTKLSNKFLMSIPHFSELFNLRRNRRYAPHEGLGVEIRIKDRQDVKIDGKLFDISVDGMRLISSDKRIEYSKTISLSVDDFQVDLPCKKIWKDQYYYGIEFGNMDQREFADLEHLIEHFIKTAPENLLEILM